MLQRRINIAIKRHQMFVLLNYTYMKQVFWNKLSHQKTIVKDKFPEVPFHGITSPYSYFEVSWIFAPIQQEAKHDQEKNISWTEIKSLLTKPSNVLPFYTSSHYSNLLYEVDFLKRSWSEPPFKSRSAIALMQIFVEVR